MLDWYRATERALYLYWGADLRKKSLELMLEEMSDGRITANYELREWSFSGVGGGVDNIVLAKIKLESELARIEKIIEIVSEALNRLEEDELNLVRAVYWEKKGWEDVCCDMGMDKNSYYKRRRGIIKKLGWLLGFD